VIVDHFLAGGEVRGDVALGEVEFPRFQIDLQQFAGKESGLGEQDDLEGNWLKPLWNLQASENSSSPSTRLTVRSFG
jgi:hypothetical protein